MSRTSSPAGEPVRHVDWLDVLTFDGGYNTNVVLLGTILLGIGAGAVGSFAMLKRRALVADAVAHASLLGVAVAFLVHGALGGTERSLPVLLTGAAAAGGLAVAAIEALVRGTRLTEDTATATVSSSFFGAGIVALSVARRTSGADQAGLNQLIFGSTAAMTGDDARTMAAISGVCIAATLVLLRPLTTVAFNPRFARTAGLPVRALDALLAALVAAVTLAGLQAVGMLLVVALLVVPAATARLWTRRVGPLVALAALLGAAAGWIGASLSAVLPDAPAGSLIVLVAASLFASSLVASPERGLLSGWVRLRSLRSRARAAAAATAAAEEVG
jgi:manganese/zinc/iron transport system permease protein